MNDTAHVPRPLLLSVNLASFALLGGFLTCSDALASAQSVGGTFLLRFLFGSATLILAVTAWKLWMRRRGALKWVIASLVMVAVAFCAFDVLVRERTTALPTKPPMASCAVKLGIVMRSVRGLGTT